MPLKFDINVQQGCKKYTKLTAFYILLIINSMFLCHTPFLEKSRRNDTVLYFCDINRYFMKPFLDSIALLMRIFVEPSFSQFIYLHVDKFVNTNPILSLVKTSLQTHHVDSTLKRRGNDRGIHAVCL